MTTYYKTLDESGVSRYAGAQWSLPANGKPGEWMPRVNRVVECVSGYHICRRKDLVYWLGPVIYALETRGQVYRYGNKAACHCARLTRRFETWTPETQRLFAADCAEHILPIFLKYYPDDSRPSDAITASRHHALGKIDIGTLRAAGAAARDASWDAAGDASRAARDAAGDATLDVEFKWQTKTLFQYLSRPVEESLELAREKLA